MEDHRSASFSSLPQEVVDHVIDRLADERRNSRTPSQPWYEPTEVLVACTLVCRAWLSRSSKYLFECLTVHPSTDPALDYTVALHKLLDHVRSSSRLSHNVVSLCIPSRPDELLVGRALDAFPRLVRLCFFGDDSRLFSMVDAEDQLERVSPPLRTRCSVRHLAFDRFYVKCVLRYLSLFNYIEFLRLDIIWYLSSWISSGTSDLKMSGATPHLYLATLAVGTSDLSALPLIQPMVTPGSLKNLHVEDLVTNACHFLIPFLQGVCSDLKVFYARIDSWMWDSPHRNRKSSRPHCIIFLQ